MTVKESVFYSSWAVDHGLATGENLPHQDPDTDNIPNALELLLGGDFEDPDIPTKTFQATSGLNVPGWSTFPFPFDGN